MKANNIPRIGILPASLNPSAVPDSRPWDIESNYYGARHTQVRSQFEGLEPIKSKPISGWGRKVLNLMGWAGLLTAIIICFARW